MANSYKLVNFTSQMKESQGFRLVIVQLSIYTTIRKLLVRPKTIEKSYRFPRICLELR